MWDFFTIQNSGIHVNHRHCRKITLWLFDSLNWYFSYSCPSLFEVLIFTVKNTNCRFCNSRVQISLERNPSSNEENLRILFAFITNQKQIDIFRIWHFFVRQTFFDITLYFFLMSSSLLLSILVAKLFYYTSFLQRRKLSLKFKCQPHF